MRMNAEDAHRQFALQVPTNDKFGRRVVFSPRSLRWYFASGWEDLPAGIERVFFNIQSDTLNSPIF